MKRSFERIHPYAWITIAGLCAWAVTLSYDFVWDDFPMIANNSSLHHWSTLWNGWFHDFWALHDSPQSSGYWRPVATMFHVVLIQMTGGAPWIFHLFNVCLHIGTAIFFYQFLVNTQLTKWVWIPVLFFLWHPIVAETVSFNSAVPDLLSAFFGWAAIAAWTDNRKKSTRQTIWTFVFLFFSFLSKETGVFFGLFIIGYDFLLGEVKKTSRTHAILLSLIGVYVLFHKLVVQSLGIRSNLWGGDFTHHIATILKLFVYQISILIFPVGSSPTRDFTIVDFSSVWAWSGLGLLSACVGLFFYFRKQKPVYAFVIFFYLIFWFPISNIIPAEGLIVDRYMYVTSMAMACAVALVFSRYETFPKLMGMILIWYAVWAINNSLVWKNSETLWKNAVKISPQSSVAWNEWGNVMSYKQKYQDAYQAYDRAVTLRPKYRDASFNRAFSSFLLKDTKVKDMIDQHLKRFPDDAQAFDLLGSIYEAESDYQSAVDYSLRATHLAPNDWKYRYNLAEVYLRMKKNDEAIEQLKIVSNQVQGHFEVVKNLAAAYCMNGQYQQCLDTYRDFLKKYPDHSQEVAIQMDQAQKLLEITQGK